MTTRTSKKTVNFRNPFSLDGVEEILPAGPYIVETDEELIEGLSFLAYRRTGTHIHIGSLPGQPGLTRTVTIDPADLEYVLERDRASQPTSIVPAARPETLAVAPKSYGD